MFSNLFSLIFGLSEKSIIFCDNAEALRHPLHKNATYSKLTKRDMDLKMEVDAWRGMTNLAVEF